MTAIHLILNMVGLLLWLKWLSVRIPSSTPASRPIGFPGASRKNPDLEQRLLWLGALALLVPLRGLVYWQIGPALHWTPHLSLGAILLTFRSDHLSRMMLFSAVGLFLTLAEFHLCLLLFSITIPRTATETPLLRTVRGCLGWVDGWPAWLKLPLPLLVAGALWFAAAPLLVKISLLLPPDSQTTTALQGLVLGASAYLAWAYTILFILLLFLIHTYVYLGVHPFWEFVQIAGDRFLKPLRAAHLRWRKVDFTPVIGIVLMWCLVRYLPPLLTTTFRRLH